MRQPHPLITILAAIATAYIPYKGTKAKQVSAEVMSAAEAKRRRRAERNLRNLK